jgi:hypothetical protein
MPQTTKESIRGTSTVKTERLQGTVEYVEGNRLVVRMSDGEIRHFEVPESRRFIIDGQEKTIHDLKPGTKLTATITTTTTPLTDRTTTVGTGTVWWVSGKTVIVTLPNGENRTYKVSDDYRFIVEGKQATVSDLRKGMRISAQKIVEEPKTELTSGVVVSGQAPPAPIPKPVAAQAPPLPVREPAPAPAPVAAPTPEPAPVTVQVAQVPPVPVQLPKTGSYIPVVGILGLLFMTAGLGLRLMNRG